MKQRQLIQIYNLIYPRNLEQKKRWIQNLKVLRLTDYFLKQVNPKQLLDNHMGLKQMKHLFFVRFYWHVKRELFLVIVI